MTIQDLLEERLEQARAENLKLRKFLYLIKVFRPCVGCSSATVARSGSREQRQRHAMCFAAHAAAYALRGGLGDKDVEGWPEEAMQEIADDDRERAVEEAMR